MGNYNQGCYGTNMWNINSNNSGNVNNCGDSNPCNECIDLIKDICILYTGPDITNSGIKKNDTLRTIVDNIESFRGISSDKFDVLLSAINELNTRLNVLDSAAHDPYTFS